MFLLSMGIGPTLRNAFAFSTIGLSTLMGGVQEEVKAEEPFITEGFAGKRRTDSVHFKGHSYGGYSGGNVMIIHHENVLGVKVEGDNNGIIYNNSPHTIDSPGATINNFPRQKVIPQSYRAWQYIGPARPGHGHPPGHGPGHPPIHFPHPGRPGDGRIHINPIEEPQHPHNSQPTQSRAVTEEEEVGVRYILVGKDGSRKQITEKERNERVRAGARTRVVNVPE